MTVASIPEILSELKAGRMVILVDEEDRENEGDLVLAAEFVTPEAINFMAKHGRGLICLTLTEERCRQLNLPLMVDPQRHPHGHQLHGVDRGGRRRHHRDLGGRSRAHRAVAVRAEGAARGHRAARATSSR